MTEVEGIVSTVDGVGELGDGMMSFEFTLSPWRRHDGADNEPGCASVAIEMDLDLADAWLRVLAPGDCVRVACSSLTADGASGDVRIQGRGEALRRHPDAWSAGST